MCTGLPEAARLFVRPRIKGYTERIHPWGRTSEGQTFCQAEYVALLYYRPLLLERQEKTAKFFEKIYYAQMLCKLYYVNFRNETRGGTGYGMEKTCGLKILRAQAFSRFSAFSRKSITPPPCRPESPSWQWRTPTASAAYHIQNGLVFLCLH